MKPKRKVLCLSDMDVGLFLSYELGDGHITAVLFRCIRLKSIPLKGILDFRKAGEDDVTQLNNVNWLNFMPKRKKNLSPVYTLKAHEDAPRIFMRLSHGSHIDLMSIIGAHNAR